ncbi:MAG: FAD-dependent oxidoreductase [Pseudomonadota bacterium]
MSEGPGTARVVIIGGGVVGISALYHLAQAGWTDCVLLEKNELTAGSTWHAAGNCPHFSPSWAVLNMQRYSLSMYRGLAEAVDYPMNYHVTGALRFGHTKERAQEFEKVAGMARAQGLEIEVMGGEEAKKFHPFFETHDLSAVLWDPLDGDIDPAQLTQAMAKGARDLGAKILRFTPATGVSQTPDGWMVHTEKGEIACEYVVNAAGYYAGRVGEWFKPFGGRDVPMAVMSHQYFLTGEIDAIKEYSAENDRLPMIRDVDSSYYLRQEKNGLNLGPYERNCRAHWITSDDPMPEDFSFQLYPDDLDRLEWYIEDAIARVPLLGEGGVERVINGPIPYAPDGLPLIGPMPGVRNAFEAHAFTFGIVQGGGAGKVLAEWIIEGETEWDMWAVDPRRFTSHADRDYCISKALETYGHEYAMHFPHREWPAARDKKLSPIHSDLLAAGAVMGAYNGWERANWFAKPGDDSSEAATETWERAGPWEIRVQEECEAVRDHVGVLEMSGFSRYALAGPGAADWLNAQVAGKLPKIGRVSLGYFSDSRGRVLTEMSILRQGEDEFLLLTAALAEWHDFELLQRALPPGIGLTNITEDYSLLLVTGPKARALLEEIGTDGDLEKRWLTHQKAVVAGLDAALVRVSFAGELGWEIHARTQDIPALYGAVIKAGATPFGMYALNSLRVEKGYRSWKGDLSTDYTLLETGLDRFIDFEKNVDFPGRAAVLAEREAGRARSAVGLEVDANGIDAPSMAMLWKDGERVGETTSGAWGYRVGASLAIGMLRQDLTAPGTEIEIDIYGEMRKAVVREMPFWDPKNERIRA